MLKVFSMTDVGQKRQINQDYVFSSDVPVGNLPNLFLVCDGMGGHKAGDYASKTTAQIIVDTIKNDPEVNPIKLIRRAIEEANRAIYEKSESDEAYNGMGTTTVLATIIEDYLYVANVGDSRLYLIDKDISQITRDHSMVEELVRKGKLDRSEARNHPDKNIITRAVGAEPTVKIDFFDLRLNERDFILMCSDGLSNMLDDDDIRLIVKSGSDVVDSVQSLINAANERGGRDNIGVVLIEN